MSETPTSQFGDQWLLAEGMWHDNLPIIMRLRVDIDDIVASQRFPVGYRITWAFQSPSDHGFPSPSDNDAMELFESRLIVAFESGGDAILVAVVTHAGERDYICYVSDPDAAHALFNEMFADEPVLPLGFVVAPDPEWAEYQGMRARMQPG